MCCKASLSILKSAIEIVCIIISSSSNSSSSIIRIKILIY